MDRQNNLGSAVVETIGIIFLCTTPSLPRKLSSITQTNLHLQSHPFLYKLCRYLQTTYRKQNLITHRIANHRLPRRDDQTDKHTYQWRSEGESG